MTDFFEQSLTAKSRELEVKTDDLLHDRWLKPYSCIGLFHVPLIFVIVQLSVLQKLVEKKLFCLKFKIYYIS
jgi:hypothetical protein